MTFKLFGDIKAFYQDTYGVLMRHEAQNLVPLGNVIIGNEGKDKTGWRDPANWLMATVSDETGIRVTAIMTPPHNLTLYATDNEFDDFAVSCLVDGIIKTGFTIGGVMTENALAERFAKTYAKRKGMSYVIDKSQRIYELTRLNPDIPVADNLRLARESDMAFLPYWSAGFDHDCFASNAPAQDYFERSRYNISTGKLYILEENGTPVTMANINREMRTVCGIGSVYTPEYFRCNGYATACVAAVSRLVLARGYSKCALYTDLANPTSNSIYQRIGYEPICDSLDVRFV